MHVIQAEQQDRVPPRIATRKSSWDATKGTDIPPAETLDDLARLLRKPSSGQSTPRRPSHLSSSSTAAKATGLADQEDGHGRVSAESHSEPAPLLAAGSAVADKIYKSESEPEGHMLDPSTTVERALEKGGSVGTSNIREPHGGFPNDSLTEATFPQEKVTQVADSILIDDRKTNVLSHAESRDLGGADGGALGGMNEVVEPQQQQQQSHQSLPPSTRASHAAEEVATALVENLAARGGDSTPPSREGHEDQEEQEDKSKNKHKNRSLAERNGDSTGEFNNEYVPESKGLRVDASSALSEGVSSSDGDTGSSRRLSSSRSTDHDVHNNNTLKNENRRVSLGSAGGQGVEAGDMEGEELQQASDAVASAAAALGEDTHSEDPYHLHAQDEGRLEVEKFTIQEGSAVALDNPENCDQIDVEPRRRPSGGRIISEDGEGREGTGNGSRRRSSSSRRNREGEMSDVGVRETLSSSSNNREVVQSPPVISRRRSSGKIEQPKFCPHNTVSHVDTVHEKHNTYFVLLPFTDQHQRNSTATRTEVIPKLCAFDKLSRWDPVQHHHVLGLL